MSEFVGNKEIFKCSKCKCKNFLEGFGTSRLGERYKTCIKCRKNRKEARTKEYERGKKQRDSNIKNKLFECKECKKCSGTNYDLEIHIKSVHLKIKDNICTYDGCDFRCSEKGQLNNHIKEVHLKIKDNFCPYDKCDYSSSRKSKTTEHIERVHLNIKRYFCKDCNNFSSYDKKDLQKHIKAVHLKIKDNICTYDNCDYSSSDKRNLHTHIDRVHLNIKNYFCDDCNNYSCYIKKELQKHQTYQCNKGDDSKQGSSGEKFIKYVLKKLNTSYLFDKPFDGISSSTGKGDVRFDFILYSNSDCPFFIEFDGRQHYEKNTFFGSDGKFETLQANDKIKDDYCDENYYPMLRIKYDTPFEEIERIVTDFVI